MRKILFALFMVFAVPVFSQAAYAGPCDNIRSDGVPDNVLIDMKKQCVERLGNSPVATAPSVDQLAEYAELGQKYGVAITSTAKAIGIAANDLARTPLGIFMLALVAYKVMGNDLIGIFGGFVWFVTTFPLWTYFFHRMVLSTRAVTERFENDKLVKREIAPVDWNNAPGVIALIMGVVFLFICISGFIMVFG